MTDSFDPGGTVIPPAPYSRQVPVVHLSPAEARVVVAEGARRYVAARRDRVEPFVDATYSLRGSLGLHRHAFGWDVARAPVNMVLALPQVAMMGAARGLSVVGKRAPGAARLADRMDRTNLFLTTDVGRELTFRLYRDFLELPMDDGSGRACAGDALALEIMNDPRVAVLAGAVARAVAEHRGDPVFRARLEQTMVTYVGSRSAAAELVNAFAAAGVGMAVAQKLTPGTWGLSQVLAAMVAQKLAVMSFPLGTSFGAAWYGLFPAAAPLALTVATTGAVMGAAAVTGAFAGVVADPLQRRLGLHQRRLHRLLDTLETEMASPDLSRPLVVRDHYVARVLDLVDLLGTAYRTVSAG